MFHGSTSAHFLTFMCCLLAITSLMWILAHIPKLNGGWLSVRQVSHSLLCDGVVVKEDATVCPGSILSFKVHAPHTTIHAYQLPLSFLWAENMAGYSTPPLQKHGLKSRVNRHPLACLQRTSLFSTRSHSSSSVRHQFCAQRTWHLKFLKPPETPVKIYNMETFTN